MFNSLNKFKKRIKQAKVKSFSDDLLGKIEMFLNNGVEAKIINKDNLHIRCFDGFELIVTLENNDIIYQVKGNNQITIGKYGEYEDGYYVRINNNLLNVFEFNTVFSKNEKTTELFRTFDKHGFEQFRRFTTKQGNYYEDKKTGNRTLHEPDIMENYTENSYMYRTDAGYILERRVRKYVYPNATKAFIDIKDTDDCLLRYCLVDKFIKEIPNCGEFYGIDNEVFYNYFKGEVTIDDVVENFKSKHYYKAEINRI